MSSTMWFRKYSSSAVNLRRPGRGLVALFVVIALCGAAFYIGFQFGGWKTGGSEIIPTAIENVSDWTCSMHPEIHRPNPGRCPICGMDLIPAKSESPPASAKKIKYACAMVCLPPLDHPGKCPVCGMEMVPVEDGDGSAAPDDARVTLSPRAQRLAELRVAPVERRAVSLELRLCGKLDFDETRMRVLSARVPGRLDKLYVNYTGVPVAQGDHIVSLHSPDLLTAQEELLQAAKGVREAEPIGIPVLRDAALQTLAATRTKLVLWGLTLEQLQEIERRDKPDDHVTIFAPMGGV